MARENPHAVNFTPTAVKIYAVNSNKALLITDMVMRFDYFEDIFCPSIAATLDIVDNGENLVSSLPIQGFEKVEVELKDSKNVTHTYEFRVFKISNRFSAERFQTYNLGLISLEALYNEGVRVPKTLQEKPEQIASNLLKEYLKTNKDVFVDPSTYKISFNPGKKTVFSIINHLQSKAVPSSSKSSLSKVASVSATGSGAVARTGITPNTPIPSTDSGSYDESSGTAGYLFYENRDGYFFKSIDKLCSKENENIGTYYLEPEAKQSDPTKRIFDMDYNSELDVMAKLRMGAYSSLICFYNFSTGAYEEYVYSLSNSFSNMNHLGSQDRLGAGQKELSKYPTRIMSMLLDHETWFNESTIASPEKRDQAGSTTTPFPDFQKNYMAQSISRIASLSNQKLNIQIAGDPSIAIGKKITVKLPNQIPTKNRTQVAYDPEHSGDYLISKVNHVFDFKNKVTNTWMSLIRDTYGSSEIASEVK